jgi:hypothetical protein
MINEDIIHTLVNKLIEIESNKDTPEGKEAYRIMMMSDEQLKEYLKSKETDLKD